MAFNLLLGPEFSQINTAWATVEASPEFDKALHVTLRRLRTGCGAGRVRVHT